MAGLQAPIAMYVIWGNPQGNDRALLATVPGMIAVPVPPLGPIIDPRGWLAPRVAWVGQGLSPHQGPRATAGVGAPGH
jgi:hypothetical protein